MISSVGLERLHYGEKVTGSNPVLSTNIFFCSYNGQSGGLLNQGLQVRVLSEEQKNSPIAQLVRASDC